MSRNYYLGEVRRGQVLGYGPGAIIDFRAGGQGGGPVSVIAAGLDQWEKNARLRGPNDPHVVHEPRLQKVLGKQSFRLPPIDKSDETAEFPDRYLNGFRFPTMLLCPECKRLDYAGRWHKEDGDPARWCGRCSDGGRRVFAVPARFVMACENGHIADFPWHSWLRRRSSHPTACSDDGERGCQLKLDSGRGAGLDGLMLSCTKKECRARTNLAGVFSYDGLQGFVCPGRKPWLSRNEETCAATPRTLQRGASNLYFPVVFSTLSIPPWSDELQTSLEGYMPSLEGASDVERETIIDIAAKNHASYLNMTIDEYVRVARARLKAVDDIDAETLRIEEFEKLKGEDSDKDFEITQETIPSSLSKHVSHIGRVSRLREVRALVDFKRIYRPLSHTDPGRGEFGNIGNGPTTWLPAMEVRGEGIFIGLDFSSVDEWASRADVSQRTTSIDAAAAEEFSRHHPDEERQSEITPHLLLVHSLAHAVIRRLAFQCGYDAASLRERIYVAPEHQMTGFLIYTSSSDADGTLGGLERQGRNDLLEGTLREAIAESEWCSSDPLCRDGISSLSESQNLAACHACLLLPETSCELGNRYLDRRMLVDDDTSLELGFFDALDDRKSG